MGSRRLRRGAAVLAAVACALVYPSAAGAVPRPHVLLGVYVKHTYRSGTPRVQLLRLERYLGRRVAIDHVGFFSWKDRLPRRRMRRDLAHGRRPLVEWAQASSREIVSGAQDRRIVRAAQHLADLPGRVLLEYGGEMDRLPAAGKPAQFIAAWRHVRSIFAAEGATNVRFVWCPTAYGFDHKRAPAYYPGDDDVDWICADGYNWGSSRPGEKWRSFQRIFASFLRWAHSRKRPILIGEWASVRGARGQRAAWLEQAEKSVEAHAQIRALCYFDTRSWDESTGKPVDWRLNTEPDAYRIFKQMATRRYFERMPKH